ncbi:30S ribosomal protein S5 [Candidatus Uhrbacteria bacterium]|nr:30S ribosomal protein S5 [Candidatus Uhrbacteria bacterium]
MAEGRPQRGGRRDGGERDFDQRILDLARVTRVTKGGKRMRFRAAVILGDRKGRVGFGVAKAGDVTASVAKATTQAKKKMKNVTIYNETIPHEVRMKYGAARVLLKPAPPGTGIKAGGAMRVIFELAGIPNIVGKILGSQNKINNTVATLLALDELRLPKPKKKAAAEAEAKL